MAVPSHQKGIWGEGWSILRRARRSRPNAELGGRSGETLGPGRYRRRVAKGGELLLSVGAVRHPWDSGAEEWSQPGQRGPQVPLDEMDKALG